MSSTTDIVVKQSTDIGVALKPPTGIESWGERKLRNEIKKGVTAAGAVERAYFSNAVRTGYLLREVQRRISSGTIKAKGGFRGWIESEKFDGSRATAYRYLGFVEQFEKEQARLISETREGEQKQLGSGSDEGQQQDAETPENEVETTTTDEPSGVGADEAKAQARIVSRQAKEHLLALAVDIVNIEADELDAVEDELRRLLEKVEERRAQADAIEVEAVEVEETKPAPRRRKAKA